MKTTFVCAAVTALLAGAPASATPTISGKYIVTITKFCQMVDTYHFSSAQGIGNYLDSINTSGSDFKQTMVLATFSPTKGTVSVNGFDDGGDVEVFQFTGSINATQGQPIAETPNTGKVAYSNTATTLTVSGQTVNAIYGQINKNGVTGYFTFQGAFQSDGGYMCTEQGTAQAQ